MMVTIDHGGTEPLETARMRTLETIRNWWFTLVVANNMFLYVYKLFLQLEVYFSLLL